MKKRRFGLGAFRVVTGCRHYEGGGNFLTAAYHMTFYAKDIHVLKFLITFAKGPLGTIFLADQIQEGKPRKIVGRPEPSIN